MSKFRISFGTASCSKNTSKNALIEEVCKEVMEKISHLNALSFEQVESFSLEETEVRNTKGKEVAYTTYKQNLENGILVVVQAFVPTLVFPNYISLHGVGKIYAEGIVFSKEGKKNIAEDSMLLGYR